MCRCAQPEVENWQCFGLSFSNLEGRLACGDSMALPHSSGTVHLIYDDDDNDDDDDDDDDDDAGGVDVDDDDDANEDGFQ